MALDIKGKLKDSFKNDRDFSLFISAGIFAGVAGGINSTIFSNFLNDKYSITQTLRGAVEFPREFPGMMIMFVLAALAFLGDIRIAAIGMVLAAAGMAGLGILSPFFGFMLVWLIIYSLGTHMVMPLTPSIGMSLSKKESYGHRLALYSAWGLFATLLGYAIVYGGFAFLHLNYTVAFLIAAVFYLIAAFIFTRMKKNAPPQKPKMRLVFKKKYLLYYALNMMNGGRKQVFLTFAPWVLITSFGLKPQQFAILGVLVSVISIGTRTIVGRAIDKLGERAVLSAEAVLLVAVCMGYIFSEGTLTASVAVIVMAACYVLDSSMSVVEMARSTYAKKLADEGEDITPTLSVGVSLDHVISMTIPFFGGLLWSYTGRYQSVFIGAAVIGAINFILATRINVKLAKPGPAKEEQPS